ncbi:DUF3560 domain-containing protein [Paenibacillus chitinolyticus]|uniref:DUF3560 domain-containing protein n=1 Tax=Paenibacillus chitinolyticus TaxID=79263 RepID=A0A410WWX5_9BACL|nr:DUF3560 domain-containing protein [Paenibacillus chitinolyticus]MCY9594122.1 DUF3560 domain-containing protein [Paenibacillus chitinolyticus]MCY9599658.1 DUF3560 domain-containing protein [Paenibacillus chitinolyticus]QAV18840.1 DUF3560 domain-containing protein [Paenibacillus chitinolyticus]
MSNQYILNRETQKIELRFTKDEYKSMPEVQKKELRRFFTWSSYAGAWVSKSTNNHYSALRVAEQLGFTNGGQEGERLSYAEQLERKAEKAERRAERYEEYADNAANRAKGLQQEFDELRKDWSWLTQPNINSSAGRAFTNQRNRVLNRYHKGFDEYRKSEYFKERAETAHATADQTKLNSKPYLNNRIEECQKEIRSLERYIVKAEERNDEEWLQKLLDRMEYEVDKLAYLQNRMDEIGGFEYSKDTVKVGYLIKVRGLWATVLKVNPKKVSGDYIDQHLKGCYCYYPYAEIEEMKIPEGWTDKKETEPNPFNVGEILVLKWSTSDNIRAAFQIVKTTDKSVLTQEIKIEDLKPIADEFISEKQQRRLVKKTRDGISAVSHGNCYLYRYTR